MQEHLWSCKQGIEDNILLSRQPDYSWEPSTIYTFEDLYTATELAVTQGIAGTYLYIGSVSECPVSCGGCYVVESVRLVRYERDIMVQLKSHYNPVVVGSMLFQCKWRLPVHICHGVLPARRVVVPGLQRDGFDRGHYHHQHKPFNNLEHFTAKLRRGPRECGSFLSTSGAGHHSVRCLRRKLVGLCRRAVSNLQCLWTIRTNLPGCGVLG